VLRLSGGARERLEELTPPGMTAVIHLTLTDEPPMAEAYVVIEAVQI
jgi:holo-[acyl-carrier protein] synthase